MDTLNESLCLQDFVGSPDPTTLGGPMGPLGHMVSLGHHHHHHHHHQSPLTQRSGMTADHGQWSRVQRHPIYLILPQIRKKEGVGDVILDEDNKN
ncbi:homeobox protein [Trichonephila clavata]|uniref:Homeobox protein n=1 Tax=Trichonephila clavata TaxID=2740835 RepID=A0A8X6GD18_TRICU|nr:homeobox protein [Trichonephila clavata]